MKSPYLTPPKSLVRYPRMTILILYITMVTLFFTTPYGWYSVFLAFITMGLILSIDDREEQRKGFFICIHQLQEFGVVTKE